MNTWNEDTSNRTAKRRTPLCNEATSLTVKSIEGTSPIVKRRTPLCNEAISPIVKRRTPLCNEATSQKEDTAL